MNNKQVELELLDPQNMLKYTKKGKNLERPLRKVMWLMINYQINWKYLKKKMKINQKI